ncbi:MAG: PEP-CTERM-box response regulator transcription factor [Desulfamplus sp.]|nr:PEP-CTERM-box response regulator transcription factor [Desulfamplus sp.]
MRKKLLVIEDENAVAKQLRWGLDKEYEITIASDAVQAKPLVASGVFQVVTLDLGLPPYPDTPQQGLKLLEEISSFAPHTRTIVITGNAEKETAIKAISLGAADFCPKPIDLSLLKIILSRTYKIQELEESNRQLQMQNCQCGLLCGMVGVSPVMIKLFEQLQHASKTDYPVLVTGNTGTGKEMAAKALHCLSQRAAKPLIIINCGAIPENLVESELFGHEKGSFTGAACRKTGRFEQADKGTLFLDEIGELPLPVQVKLLRFLQESTIDRVGGSKTISVDVRIVAATNIDLEDAVKNGTFREDLFYRLNVVPLKLPDLKERPEDILLLAHNFLLEETRKLKRAGISFSPAAIAALTAHEWPGNVRELKNRIRRALGTTMDRFITPVDLGLEETQSRQEEQKLPSLKEVRETAEKKAVRHALALSGNNISQAARLLEISRPTLHDILKKYDIGT